MPSNSTSVAEVPWWRSANTIFALGVAFSIIGFAGYGQTKNGLYLLCAIPAGVGYFAGATSTTGLMRLFIRFCGVVIFAAGLFMAATLLH